MTNNIKEIIGARILSAANDLKRTNVTLSKELKIPQKKIDNAISGKLKIDQLLEICKLMSDTYPISLSDIWIEKPESLDNVYHFTSALSKKSSRIFKRENINGLIDYYEYRDTACTTLAPFYPEWIKPIVITENNDPKSKLVVLNKGHLLHQQTFFIGKVNFYWKDKTGLNLDLLNFELI